MRFILVCLLVICNNAKLAAKEQPSSQQNLLTSEQIAEGWLSLFDGETLFGWKPTSEANWRVENGVIKVDQGEPSWLMTTSEFADYELVVEFRCPRETNSGLFLRSSANPKDPSKDCLELNIAPLSHEYPTGNFVGRKRVGREELEAGPGTKPLAEPDYDLLDDQWHTIYVKAWSDGTWTKQKGYVGQVFGVYSTIDNKSLRAITDNQLTHGHIGLQFRKGPIEFRNIRLRPRGSRPIFDGNSLAGWNTDKAEASRFEVAGGGELRVLDGRGQLESEKSYGDFLLQLDCRVDGDGLNSGVFFRCIPGDFMMGYECQISNAMQDGDPTQPADCGTGGIFRRQNARRIVAKDHEWFTMTLLANGPHIASWVNGYQVSDWTDTREPHENPRKGLRLEPGTLAIQGHDPTTDIRFKNLQIVELPNNE